MGFLKRLTGLLAAPATSVERSVYPIRVQCSRCGEIVETPLNLYNDLSADYDEGSGATTFVCRKVLTGRQRCFQQIEVTLRFDVARKLLDREIGGGKFAEPDAQ